MQDANTGTRQDNLYAPPTARVADPYAQDASRAAPFHVVSTTKVAFLSFFTFGLYSLYWFWRHWESHKIDRKLDIWPVPRALFSIFYAHSLNSEIDHRIVRNGARHPWSPGLWATLYVVAIIVNRVANRLPETVVSPKAWLLMTFVTILVTTASLFQAQQAANIASGDPEALANNRFSVANGIWIVIGVLFWLLVSLGAMVSEEPI